MANWTDLSLSDGYVAILSAINDRDLDAAKLFSSAPTSPVVGMIRYNRSTNKFEEYRTTPAAAWYELNIALEGGGTGANTASGARSALGLGTMATQFANSVSINGGSIAADVIDSSLMNTARLGTGLADSSSFLRGDRTWQAPAGMPTGGGCLWFSAVAPTGYFLCDGTAKNRVTYAALFALIGVTYGAGDGVNTFNLPDLRQRFPLGKAAAGTGSTLGATGGTIDHVHNLNNHAHTYTEIVQHTHPITDAGHDHDYDVATGGSAGSGGSTIDSITSGTTGSRTTGITVDNPVGSVATGTTNGNVGDTGTGNPPYQVVNYIIKY